jgi:hypothetical protein
MENQWKCDQSPLSYLISSLSPLLQSDSIKITVPPKPQTLKEIRNGRKKWTTDDLPTGAGPQFRDDVTPLVRELMGFQHDPWEPFADEQVQGILDIVYSKGPYDVKAPIWHGLVRGRFRRFTRLIPTC